MDLNDLYIRCKEQVKKKVLLNAAYTDEAVCIMILDVIAEQHKKEWIPLCERICIGRKIFNAEANGQSIFHKKMSDLKNISPIFYTRSP